MQKSEIADIQVIETSLVVTLNVEKILAEDIIDVIEEMIIDVMEKNKTNSVVINFSNVEFLTSSFLGFLIRFSKRVYENQGQLRLCGINDKIYGIFKITRLDKIFDIHADVDKALLSLGQV